MSAAERLHPLTFRPRSMERVWGGRRLADLYRKALPEGVAVGESWEICDRPDAVSEVLNGPLAGKDLRWLMTHHRAALLGDAADSYGRFPLLVKLLDARQVLSLQVHPPAERAAALGGEPKTELWYVAHAEPGAQVWAGFREPVTPEAFAAAIRNGRVEESIHRLPVRAGDVLFLPSGRVHALGAGCVVFEIQENSDTTYRVYDWNRVGTDGRPRTLHVEAALASIDFHDLRPGLVEAPWMETPSPARRLLASNACFRIEEWRLSSGASPLAGPDRPLVLAVTSGWAAVRDLRAGISVDLRPGEFALAPASIRSDTVLEGEGRVLVAEPGTKR